MTISFVREPGNSLAESELPNYARMLHAYHRARAADLRAIIATLPLIPDSRVLDVPSGDGCYSIWLAERAGQVVGVDLSPAFLALAQHTAATAPHTGQISFERATVESLPFRAGSFDLVWCAQSLFSLPDPLVVVREMIRVARPGGYVVILENDILHQLVLPWPAELELAVRQAQLAALAEQRAPRGPDKFYIGRNLCGLLYQCGVELCATQTFPIDIHAPLDADEKFFLRHYFADLRALVWCRLEPAAQAAFDMLCNPHAPTYLPRQPGFHATHIEFLATGQVAS
jgi:SAM-dependent methyltransferase